MPFGWEILIATAFGFVGGYAGIAGAPFIIFLLSSVLGYSQHLAQGTTLAMMLGPMTILPVRYGRDIVRRRKKEILTSVFAYMGCSFAGAQIAYLLSSAELRFGFGLFIGMLGIVYILFSIRSVGQIQPESKNISLFKMALIGAAIGTVGGITGIGAGILLVPLLTMWFGLEQHEAQTMSLAILLPPVSLGAVIKYGLLENDVNWPAALSMLAVYVGTSGLGYRFSFRHSTLILRIILAVLLISVGVIHILGVVS